MWLDGAYLGDPEGYFFPHRFDITSLARLSADHVLAVEVTCAPAARFEGQANITGVFQDGEAFDRDWNPGGLWRPVGIDITGPVRIDRCRVLGRDANDTRAPSAARPARQRCAALGAGHHMDRRAAVARQDHPWRAAATRSRGTSTSPSRSCGGRGRWAINR